MKCKYAFAACGICPFNLYAIDMKRLMPSTANATPVPLTQFESSPLTYSAENIPTPVALPLQGTTSPNGPICNPDCVVQKEREVKEGDHVMMDYIR